MSFENEPNKPNLPEGFISQEQYSNMINSEALRRISAIEAKQDMSPSEISAYDAKKKIEFKQAIDTTLMNIDDPAKRKAFRQRIEYITSSSASNEITIAIDRIKQEESLKRRKDKKLPPVPPLRKPKRK